MSSTAVPFFSPERSARTRESPHEQPMNDENTDSQPIDEAIQHAEIEHVFEIGYTGNNDGSATVVGCEPTQEEASADVRVLQLPMAFVVELRISPSGTTNYTITQRLQPRDATGLAQHIRSQSTGELVQTFGEAETAHIADALEAAASYAGRHSLTELIGEDNLRAYRDGKITMDELSHEAERKIDNMFDDM